MYGGSLCVLAGMGIQALRVSQWDTPCILRDLGTWALSVWRGAPCTRRNRDTGTPHMGGTPGILKGWTQTLRIRAGRGTHFALPGIRELRHLALPETNQHRVLESYTPSSPESKTSVTRERDSWRVLVLERRCVSNGPTDVETRSEGGRRIHCLPSRDLVSVPAPRSGETHGCTALEQRRLM